MNVTRFLKAEVTESGAIVLETTDAQDDFKVLGSSLKTNWSKANTGFNDTRSLVIYPNPGERGIVAVSLRVRIGTDYKGRPNREHLPVFLEVTQKDGKPWVNLDKSWAPTERSGMLSDYKLSVEIKGRTFLLDTLGIGGKEKQPNICLVSDGDLLCRYLYGTAPAHEVVHAAVQEALEPSREVRIEALTREVRRLSPLERALEDYESLKEFSNRLYGSYAAVREIALDAKWLSKLLKENRWTKIFLSSETREKVDSFLERFDTVGETPLENKVAA